MSGRRLLAARLQCGTELGRRCESIRRGLGQRAIDRLLETYRHSLPDYANGGRVLMDVAREDRLGCCARKWRLAGQHLVDHAAEGVNVGASVESGATR